MKRSRLKRGTGFARKQRMKFVGDAINDVERNFDTKVVQWFERDHIEQFLGRKLNDQEWDDLKNDDDFWLTIADDTSDDVSVRIHREMEELKEMRKKGEL